MAVGKRVLASAFGRSMGARLVVEASEANPFLRTFYRQPKEGAFQAQMFSLLSRFRLLSGLEQGDLFQRRTVSDFCFAKDRIFAVCTLDPAELALYDRMSALLAPRIATPDLIVYLQCPPEVVHRRIQRRGRSVEAEVSLDFVTKICRAYSEHFFRYRAGPLLIVNASELDFERESGDVDEILGVVEKMRRGVEHYNPMPRGRA